MLRTVGQVKTLCQGQPYDHILALRVKAGILWLMTTDIAGAARAPWVPTVDSFAARLALIRHQMGWNVKEAARACGLPGASWRLWEMDGAVPRDQVAIARRIATASGCDYLWLLLGPDGTRRETLPGPSLGLGERVIRTVGADPRATPGRAVRQTRPMTAGALRPASIVAS